MQSLCHGAFPEPQLASQVLSQKQLTETLTRAAPRGTRGEQRQNREVPNWPEGGTRRAGASYGLRPKKRMQIEQGWPSHRAATKASRDCNSSDRTAAITRKFDS
jgi:hypothetical protein